MGIKEIFSVFDKNKDLIDKQLKEAEDTAKQYVASQTQIKNALEESQAMLSQLNSGMENNSAHLQQQIGLQERMVQAQQPFIQNLEELSQAGEDAAQAVAGIAEGYAESAGELGAAVQAQLDVVQEFQFVTQELEAASQGQFDAAQEFQLAAGVLDTAAQGQLEAAQDLRLAAGIQEFAAGKLESAAQQQMLASQSLQEAAQSQVGILETQKAAADAQKLAAELQKEAAEIQQEAVEAQRSASDAIKEGAEKQKEAAEIQKEASEVQREAAETQKEASEAQKEAAESQKGASDVQKEASTAQKEAADAQKDAADTQKDAAKTLEDAAKTQKEAGDAAKDAAKDQEDSAKGSKSAAEDAKKAAESQKKAAEEGKKATQEQKKEVGGLQKALKGLSSTAATAMKNLVGLKALKGYAAEGAASATTAIKAEMQLTRAMEKSTEASGDEIKMLLDLAKAQQGLGVIDTGVQMSGMEQMSAYIAQADDIKALLPLMNDMLVNQHGLDASQEDAKATAEALGKAVQGQADELIELGYAFDEAQLRALQYGDEAERIAIVAGSVGAAVGGMNAEMADTDLGNIQRYKNELGGIKEQLGKGILPIMGKASKLANDLLPYVEQGLAFLLPILDDGADKLAEMFESAKPAIDWVIQEGLPAAMDKLGDIGENLLPRFQDAFSTILPLLQDGKERLCDMFERARPAIDWVIQEGLPAAVDLFGDIVQFGGTVVETIDKWGLWEPIILGIVAGLTAFKAIGIAKTIMSTVSAIGSMTVSPIAAVALAIGAVVAIGVLVYKNWDTIKAKAQEAWGKIADGVSAVKDWIVDKFTVVRDKVEGIFSGIAEFFSAPIELIKNHFQGIVTFVKGIFSGDLEQAFEGIKMIITGPIDFIRGIIDGVKEKFGEFLGYISDGFTQKWGEAWEGVKEVFGNIFSNLGDLVKTPINAVISLVNKAIGSVNDLAVDVPDWVPLIGGNHLGFSIPTIPLLAKGGVATAPTLAVVGEGREAEAILPLSSLQGMLNAQMGAVSSLLRRFLDVSGAPGGTQAQYVFSPNVTFDHTVSREEAAGMMQSLYAQFTQFMDRYARETKRKGMTD